ncbi:MAG: hypothetical protein ACYC8T_28060 [Myxococcaceae bacterium]
MRASPSFVAVSRSFAFCFFVNVATTRAASAVTSGWMCPFCVKSSSAS